VAKKATRKAAKKLAKTHQKKQNQKGGKKVGKSTPKKAVMYTTHMLIRKNFLKHIPEPVLLLS